MFTVQLKDQPEIQGYDQEEDTEVKTTVCPLKEEFFVGLKYCVAALSKDTFWTFLSSKATGFCKD